MQNMQVEHARSEVRVNSFITSVYNWMAIGLAITGAIAYLVSSNQYLLNIIAGNPMIFFGLIIGELGLVFYLSARVQKVTPLTATALFVIYAALNGATLSCYF